MQVAHTIPVVMAHTLSQGYTQSQQLRIQSQSHKIAQTHNFINKGTVPWTHNITLTNTTTRTHIIRRTQSTTLMYILSVTHGPTDSQHFQHNDKSVLLHTALSKHTLPVTGVHIFPLTQQSTQAHTITVTQHATQHNTIPLRYRVA